MQNKHNGIPCKNCGHLYWHWDHCCDDFNPDEKKISIKKKIDFIKEKCGGDSLSHVLDCFRKKNSYFQLSGGNDYWAKGCVEITVNKHGESYEDLLWELLIDTKEAKLQDQSDESLNSLATILGYENE